MITLLKLLIHEVYFTTIRDDYNNQKRLAHSAQSAQRIILNRSSKVYF